MIIIKAVLETERKKKEEKKEKIKATHFIIGVFPDHLAQKMERTPGE